jgi:hypothetical protein
MPRRVHLSLPAVLVLIACSGTTGSAAPTASVPGGPPATPTALSSASSPQDPSSPPATAATAPSDPIPTSTATTATTASAPAAPTATPGASPTATAAASPTRTGVLGWQELAVEGETPAAREDHTWTLNDEGTVAYLFGGRADGEALGDLWVYDLTADRWERRDPARGPSERFGHTATWVPDVGLVVWSGQAGSDFFGDVWAYDPMEDRWRELPASGEVPAARYGACADLGPDGRLWISHGFTFEGRFDDTRAYDFESGEWVDLTPTERPALRCLHECLWADDGRFLLYGGQTNDAAALGDLWALEPPREDGADAGVRWMELRGGPPPRNLYAAAEVAGDVYVFGGSGTERVYLDDLWLLETATDQWRALEPESTRRPEGRSGATFVADRQRGRLLLFGGETADSVLDDLWSLSLP